MIFFFFFLNRGYNFARVCFIYNLINRVFRHERLILFTFRNFLCTSSIQKQLPINDFKSRRHVETVFCNKIEGVVPNSVSIFCLFVCLFVCLLFALRRIRISNQTLVKHPNAHPFPTPRVEVVLPSVKFNPAWLRHFLLSNRKGNKQESTT